MTESVYPHTGLILGSPNSILISGPHIQIIQTQTGDIIHSTASSDEITKNSAINSGPIRCYTVNQDLSVLVTAGDDKKLKVWQLDGLKIRSERELPKKPTQIRLTKDDQTILVSDKFGDVFSYPLTPDPSIVPDPDQGKRGALTSHENPSNGTLILGHTSLLTSFVLTDDEKYIISADRDEHIRVSWFPQGYVIERYCLGHKKCVLVISTSPGGDPELKVWNWLSGKLLHGIPISEAVEPYIKVKPPKSKLREGDTASGDGSTKPQGRGRRRRRGKQQEATEDVDVAESGDQESAQNDSGDVVMDEQDGGKGVVENDVEGSIPPVQEKQESERPVLMINRIDSVDRGVQGRNIIFSAVGSTALYRFILPSEETSSPPKIQAFDLGKPVIDFVVRENSMIWVLVDGRWNSQEEEDGEQTVSKSVRLVGWSGDGELVELSEAAPFLAALNSKCFIPASGEDLKALDLYAPLSSMPKNMDAECDPMSAQDLTDLATSFDENAPVQVIKRKGKGQRRGQGPGGGLTQRELARLKNKKALLAKIQEQQGQDLNDVPEVAQEGVEGEDDREAKKVKGDGEIVDGGAMNEG